MSHSQGARAPAREGRGEPETITILDLPPKRILHEPCPRRAFLPHTWEDAAYASVAAFFLTLTVVLALAGWVLLAPLLGGHS